jgi:hypothetical protein
VVEALSDVYAGNTCVRASGMKERQKCLALIEALIYSAIMSPSRCYSCYVLLLVVLTSFYNRSDQLLGERSKIIFVRFNIYFF